jgi:hypothetical protein
MATRTWIGGGNNRASNENDWTPTGVPQAGDVLTVGSPGAAQSPYTLNVHGNDLAGDRLAIGAPFIPRLTTTINLAHKATVTATVWNADATFNLSQHSALNLEIDSGAHVGTASAVVNLSGADRLTLINNDSPVTVNLNPGARWHGTLTMGFFGQPVRGLTAVTGGSNTAFKNNGASLIGYDNTATINTDVVGHGSFDVVSNFTFARPKLEFMQSVGSHQSVSDAGLLQIDKPDEFHAAVTLKSAPAGSSLPAEIDLMGLATADSYSYQNDMLRIFSGSQVIDRLRLHDATANGFAVQKTAGSVNIVAITDPTSPPVGLPVHL